jgi:hypothetical protein
MYILQIMRSAMGNEAVVKVGAQHGQCHFAKARKHQRLRIVERLVEGGIYRLFDEALRRLRWDDGMRRRAAGAAAGGQGRSGIRTALAGRLC